MNKYNWTKAEENKALAMYRGGNTIADIARLMKIPYNSVSSLLQRKMVLKSRSQDPALIAQMAKMYTISELCEKLNLSEYSLRTLATRYAITLAKTKDQLPSIYPFASRYSYCTCSTLANAVAQANAEKYAIVSKHTYMPNTLYKGMRCAMVEFIVINERNERLWDGLPVQIQSTDIYVKTPTGGNFVISDEEIMRLSNVINNNVTIIISDNERE